MSTATPLVRTQARPGKARTPARLRRWQWTVALVALLLLAATSPMLAWTQAQVRIIGTEAGPQVTTASELYFALSDLDAQVARLVLINHSPELSSSQLDGLNTYHDRNAQIDAHVAHALTTAGSDADRAAIVDIMNDLAGYRQWAAQALTVGQVVPAAPSDDTPAEPANGLPPAAIGFYSQATNILHLDLLPAVTELRESSQARLDQAYAQQRTTRWWGLGLLVGLGGLLVLLLVSLQVELLRRFRRLLNPALLVATVLATGLVIAAGSVYVLAGQQTEDTRRDSLAPYLALAQAQAVSYDAAADTTRYLLSANDGYDQSFAAKSQCLVEGGACGTGDTLDGGLAELATDAGFAPEQAQGLLDRWLAYQQDHERIVAVADSGDRAGAIEALTGIQRGDAAFDFYYFDVAMSELAADRRASFDAAMDRPERLLTGWSVIPIGVLAGVVVLLLLGLRPRLAEYRD